MHSVSPWFSEPEQDALNVIDATNIDICTVWQYDRPPQEALANLNVILAAPEMLADLQWLLATVPLSKAQIRRVEKTINKAMGEQA